MRRLTWLAPALAALVLVVTPTAAAAEGVERSDSEHAGDVERSDSEHAGDVEDLAGDAVVLAAEAEGGDLGPEPQPRNAEGNQATTLAGYEDPEVQFTWAASFLLLGGVVTAIVVGGALWYLLVVRPTKQAATD